MLIHHKTSDISDKIWTLHWKILNFSKERQNCFPQWCIWLYTMYLKGLCDSVNEAEFCVIVDFFRPLWKDRETLLIRGTSEKVYNWISTRGELTSCAVFWWTRRYYTSKRLIRDLLSNMPNCFFHNFNPEQKTCLTGHLEHKYRALFVHYKVQFDNNYWECVYLQDIRKTCRIYTELKKKQKILMGKHECSK